MISLRAAAAQPPRRPRTAPHRSEHEHEAAPGLPAALPAGEQLLWQGAPEWRLLAQRCMHLRGLTAYFGLLALWRGAAALADGAAPASAAASALWTLPLAALSLGLLALLGWLVARNTVYSLTDKRVVMRIGVVLTVTFNLPLARIAAAQLRPLPGGAGDIALMLHADDRIGWLHLWPHVRPWQLARSQPMLRALPDAAAVARLLAAALERSAAGPA